MARRRSTRAGYVPTYVAATPAPKPDIRDAYTKRVAPDISEHEYRLAMDRRDTGYRNALEAQVRAKTAKFLAQCHRQHSGIATPVPAWTPHDDVASWRAACNAKLRAFVTLCRKLHPPKTGKAPTGFAHLSPPPAEPKAWERKIKVGSVGNYPVGKDRDLLAFTDGMLSAEHKAEAARGAAETLTRIADCYSEPTKTAILEAVADNFGEAIRPALRAFKAWQEEGSPA